MIAISIYPRLFAHFDRRLRAIPLPLRASTPLQAICPVLFHIVTLSLPLHDRRPLVQIPGLAINTPPNHQLLTSASTPKLQSTPFPDFVQPEF